MSIEQKEFGRLPDGRAVELFTFKNRKGCSVSFITYGGIITSMITPDRDGKFGNITLCCATLDEYLRNDIPYFGSIIGRVANRIGNAKFTLDDKEYVLAKNDGEHHLHGGPTGWSTRLWNVHCVCEGIGMDTVVLHYHSPDGEENYPGAVDAYVQYSLDDHNDFRIEYRATTDKATPINMTNHAYFNMTGEARDVQSHILTIRAKHYTPVTDALIPDGTIVPVKDTPYDFTIPKYIGRSIVDGLVAGYDHNYVLEKNYPTIYGERGPDLKMQMHFSYEHNNPPKDLLARAAWLQDIDTGRTLETLTDAPAIQFYTGNFLDGSFRGPGGGTWNKHFGFCLETQGFPDAINRPEFPSIVLRPGEVYRHTTIYRFGVA